MRLSKRRFRQTNKVLEQLFRDSMDAALLQVNIPVALTH
jgi:hypothetical protein